MTLSSASVLFVAYNPEDVKPGWIALVLVIALAVATYLLWRSMNKQLRNIDVPTAAELRGQQAEPRDGQSEPPTGEQPPADPDDDSRPTT
ncbi:MAG: hypothetical protein ACR2FP_00945 [Nocardioidaceae bacterium]